MFKRTSKLFSKRSSKPRAIKRHTILGRLNTPQHKNPQTTELDDLQDKPIHVMEQPKANRQPSHLAIPFLKRSTILHPPTSKKRIGIFCDSLLYADFIRSSLQVLEIDIQYFGHPNTFQVNKYTLYDNISAWVIFLSDGSDYLFLDNFLDRYVNKPTLFLNAQTNRVKTSEKINQFVTATELFKPTGEVCV